MYIDDPTYPYKAALDRHHTIVYGIIEMNLHGIGPTTIPTRPQAAQSSRKNQAAVSVVEQSETDSRAQSKSSPGVIQNIREGHYRGVADVRLRINFYEQLAASQHEESSAVFEDASTQLSDTVTSEIQSLLDDNQLTEDQENTLSNALNEFQTSLDGIVASDVDPKDVIDEVSQARDTLFESLSSLLVDNASEEVDVLEPAGESTEGATSTSDDIASEPASNPADPTVLEDFYNKLSATFNEQLEALKTSLLDTSLPDLSPPNGNGVAYDKFLAVYEDLQGSEDVENDGSVERVDTVA